MATYQGVEIDLEPTAGMRREAALGLRWREKYNRGGTAVGVGTARAILSGGELSVDRVRRMYAYFERHAVDRDAPGFEDDGSEDFPSAGKIAWLLWGGDPGRTWSTRKRDQLMTIDQGQSSETRKVSLRQMPCAFKALSTSHSFDGYASVYDVVDAFGDIVDRNAFTETLAAARRSGIMPAMLWQHDATMPIGVWTDITPDEYGLHVTGQLADTTMGNEAYTLMKLGALSGLSIGYSVVREEYDPERDARLLKQVQLWEISPVTFPANRDARVEEVKSTDSGYRGLERILREAGFSRSESKVIASRGLTGLREADASGISPADLDALIARWKH